MDELRDPNGRPRPPLSAIEWAARLNGVDVPTLLRMDGRLAADEGRLQHGWRGLTGVYFIGCNDEFVKIGYSTHAFARLDELQAATPYELILLRVMPGTLADEGRYHARFAELRVAPKGKSRHRKEWFRYDGELRHWLEAPAACLLTDPTLKPKLGPLPV